MSNLYLVGIRSPAISGGASGSVFTGNGPDRYVHIVTDTIMNAMAIARTRCRAGESVLSIQLQDEDIVVDLVAAQQDS